MAGEFCYMNEVLQQGTVVAKREGKGYVLLTIATDLTPVFSGGERAWKRNYPKAMFAGAAAEKARQFKVKDYVTVKGQAGTRKGRLGEKEAYLFSFNATDIEEAPKVYISDGVAASGKVYESEMNEVRLAGKITTYSAINANMISLRISVEDENGRKHYVDAVYRTEVKDFASKIAPGDSVYLIGQIQTREPDISRTRKTEWLSAKEVIKAEERSISNV